MTLLSFNDKDPIIHSLVDMLKTTPVTGFVEGNFFHEPGQGDGLGMIQAHYIYCTLHLYYCYISSTSDHQALDPRGWGPCFKMWNPTQRADW